MGWVVHGAPTQLRTWEPSKRKKSYKVVTEAAIRVESKKPQNKVETRVSRESRGVREA